MDDYKKIETSAEVWAVIRAKHGKELKVFSTFSDPDGSFCGGDEATMYTAYGFEGCDTPIIEAETKWTIDRERPHSRTDEKTKYWICLGIEQD